MRLSDSLGACGNRLLCATSTTVLATLAATSAGAQEDSRLVLEEITVTARKVEENLQRTPVAVTALTAAAIEERNLINVLDAGASAPNVIIEQNGSVQGAGNNPAIFIRGVGQSDMSSTAVPAVGTYIDGVYIAANLGNILNLLDLKQVEILRGPQGTLFGRNTIGGAISLVSQEPTPAFGFTAEASFGEDSLQRTRLSLNAPISDTVLTRFAALTSRQDGYVELNNYPGKAYGDTDDVAFRGQLRWLPSDAITIDLAADYSRGRGSGAPAVLRGLSANAPNALLYNLRLSGNPSCLSPMGQANNPACWGPVQLPQDLYRSDALLLTGSSLPLQRVEPTDDYDIYGVNGMVDWNLGFATLKSITAYRDQDVEFHYGVGDFFFFQINSPKNGRHQFSQEIQLSGHAFNGRLGWLAGGYYFEEGSRGEAELLAALSIVTPNFPTLVRTRGGIDNDNIAFFGQTNFDMTDRLHLTTGLRWTKERNGLSARGVQFPNGLSGEQTSEVWTPLVTVSADLTDDVLGYVTYSRGFRSGGFPARITGTNLQRIPTYEPEFVDSYEAGVKTVLLGRRLIVNGAVFYMDYADVQATGTNTDFNPPVPSIVNAGDATIQGAEIEITAALASFLRIEFSAGYLDNELDSINPTAVDDGVPVTLDNVLPYTPEWKLAAGATVTLPLGAGTIVGRIDWSYMSSHFFTIGNFDLAGEDGYQRLNASLAYQFPGDRWKVEVAGKNLTDEQYYTGGLRDFSFAGLAQSTISRPRYVYGTVSYSF